MSYDITLRRDRFFSGETDLGRLRDFLVSFPGLAENGEHNFSFGDAKALWMEIDLEQVDEEGDAMDDDGEAVNCISCHVPYDFWDNQKKAAYYAVCVKMAGHLGWEIFDPQTGETV